MTVKIELSGALRHLASGPSAIDIAGDVEREVGEIAGALGLPSSISVDVCASDSPRPLRVECNGIAVPYPPDLLSQLTFDGLGASGDDGFGPTIADACLSVTLPRGDCSSRDVAHLAIEMIRDRPSVLVDYEGTEEVAALERVRAALLDLGVVPSQEQAIVDALRRSGGSVPDAIEAAFTMLQGREIEIVLGPEYCSTITGITGRNGDDSALVADTPLEPLGREMFEALEQRLLVEWGIVAPDLRWASDPGVPEGSIAVRINHRRSTPVRGLQEDECILLDPTPDSLSTVQVAPKRLVANPANAWLELAVVDAAATDRLPDDIVVAPPAGFAALVVYRELVTNAHRLLSTEQTLYLLQDFRPRGPELVALVLRHLTLAEITRVLRALVRERIPPRLLPVVLEELARSQVIGIAPSARVEYVRRGLSEYIRHRFGRGGQARTFFELSPDVESLLAATDDRLAGEHIRDAVWEQLVAARLPPVRAAVLAPKAVRGRLYGLLEPELPEIAVLLRADFGDQVPEPVARIELGAAA